MKNAKNKKMETVDPHLMHVYKNTTPAQRLKWLKRALDFARKMKFNKK